MFQLEMFERGQQIKDRDADPVIQSSIDPAASLHRLILNRLFLVGPVLVHHRACGRKQDAQVAQQRPVFNIVAVQPYALRVAEGAASRDLP